MRQVVQPFVVTVGVGVLLVWLSQALRLLRFIFTHGQAFDQYAYMTALTLPPAMNILLPLALFITTIYVLTAQHRSGEGVVMASSGIARLQRTIPFAVVSLALAGVVTVIAITVAPASVREAKRVSDSVRADFVAALLQEGQFNHPAAGMTFFIRQKLADGNLRDLMIADARDKANRRTYTAKTGYLLEREDERVVMVLQDGTLVTSQQSTGKSQFLKFSHYTIDLSEFIAKKQGGPLSPSARTLEQLQNPAPNDWIGNNRPQALQAEALRRFTDGLYAPALVLLVCAVFAGVRANRQHVVDLITAAAVAGILVRILGLVLAEQAERDGGVYLGAMVALPLVVTIGAFGYLGTSRTRRARRIHA